MCWSSGRGHDRSSPVCPAVLDELLHGAFHNFEKYANDRVDADHGRLMARLRPMRGLKVDRNASMIVAGHAFVQNLRRSQGSTTYGFVFGPAVQKGLLPTLNVIRSRQAVVDGPSYSIGGIAALVVAQQVVGQEQVSSVGGDLHWVGQEQWRIEQRAVPAAWLERPRSPLPEQALMVEMRAGPDPKVAALTGSLIGHDHPGEHGERRRWILAGAVAVDVGATRHM